MEIREKTGAKTFIAILKQKGSDTWIVPDNVEVTIRTNMSVSMVRSSSVIINDVEYETTTVVVEQARPSVYSPPMRLVITGMWNPLVCFVKSDREPWTRITLDAVEELVKRDDVHVISRTGENIRTVADLYRIKKDYLSEK